jgi:glycosyltransferase involved in cell wall biosynthesis
VTPAPADAATPGGGIHQFVPMLHVGDAVGQHTVELQRLLRAAGTASDVYVEHDDPETAADTIPVRRYPERAQPGDVLVYQFATASDVATWLVARTEPLVVNYHNITPAGYFAPWDNPLALHQARARYELAELAGRATLAVAVSEHNRADLVDTGFAATAVVPPIVRLTGGGPDGPEDGMADDGGSPERPRGGGARWLAVGRLAPNKAVEDIFGALLVYRAQVDPDATVDVVGRAAVPSYGRALRRFAAELGLADAVRFCGRLSDDELVAAYRHADVLVITSEHEGFCLPAVEAMAHGLPVVAYDEGALPEVLGDAGVLVDRKDPATLVSAVARVQSDPDLRRTLQAAGRRRLAALGLETAGPRLVGLLTAVRDGRALGDGVRPRGPGETVPDVAAYAEGRATAAGQR